MGRSEAHVMRLGGGRKGGGGGGGRERDGSLFSTVFKKPTAPPTHTHSHSAQSARFGTRIFSETVTKVDLSKRPFAVATDERKVRRRERGKRMVDG